MAHVRDRPSLRESVEIITPSGNRYRWSDDEDSPANVPSGERFTDTMPGGFAEHDAVLPRKPAIDYADLERLSTITRYDASGGIIWQGRLERAPKVSGDQIAISPSAVGWQAHLNDDKSAAEIYIGRDLRQWREPGLVRRAALTTGGTGIGTIGTSTGSSPALVLGFVGAWAAGIGAEAYYEAPPGANVASLSLSWAVNGNVGATAAFIFQAWSTDDEVSFPESTGDQLTGAATSGTLTFSPTARREMMVRFSFATAGGGDGANYEIALSDLYVFGDHGLTIRGTSPAEGFYDGDIIGHALSRWCPLLNVTSESLTSASFIIPQAAFLEPTTAGEIIRQTNRFGLRDWAVWDNLTFWLHDRGARGTAWRARVGPSGLEETGPQVDRLWESVIVAYQDVDGSTRTVGPVGSGADTETDDLKDDDPDNPANRLGITRRDMLSMGTSTAAGATEVGRRFLEETKALDSSGRARITGHVQDSTGVWHPYSHVRSGDTITFVDASDTSARRIVKTDKSRDDRSCSTDLDSPPEGLQALLERLGVVLVPLGI